MHFSSVQAAALCAAFFVSGTTAWAADTAPVGWRSDSLRVSDTWNTFTADMRITRKHVKRDGTAISSAIPEANYRVERSNRTGNWKTVTTVLGVTQADQYAFDGTKTAATPVIVKRLEDDEDGTPLRAFDTKGKRIGHFKNPVAPVEATAATTSSSTVPRSTGRDWINRMVALKSKAKDRLRAFERTYGPPVRSGGFNVHTSKVGDVTRRVVVDPANAVAVEYSETRGTARTMKVNLRYGPVANDGVVRLGVRSEVSVSADVDDVVVVDASYSNIALARR